MAYLFLETRVVSPQADDAALGEGLRPLLVDRRKEEFGRSYPPLSGSRTKWAEKTDEAWWVADLLREGDA